LYVQYKQYKMFHVKHYRKMFAFGGLPESGGGDSAF